MIPQPQLSIVVAVKDADANLPAILAALAGAPADAELILCVAGPAPRLPPLTIPTRVLVAARETLVPLLWRDGILAAAARRVALTTAQCIPTRNWAERARAVDVDRWAGVGGAIDNDPRASPANWAIFFLRYSAFAPPLSPGETSEIAADNAIYDRDAILAHSDLLAEGFWEPSFHRRFRASGRALALDPAIVVVHHGLVDPAVFVGQRRAHGHEYGEERGRLAGRAGSAALLLRSPLLPPLILARVVGRSISRPAYRGHVAAALPWLIRFILGWVHGEARGYGSALASRGRIEPNAEGEQGHG